MKTLLNFLSIAITSIAFAAAIWIVIPAPATFVWLLAVAASEWSLWLGLAALLGIICALIARQIEPSGSFWLAPVVIGGIALIVSLYPLVSVYRSNAPNDVSLTSYFAGLNASRGKNNFTTFTYQKDLQLDVYQPTAQTENNGASVVVIHGGSWSSGSRGDFPQWNEWLAAQGFTVFDVDYSLIQPNYLTATGDIKCAVVWIKQHAAEFKIAPDRIAFLGRSAGAHLALLAAYAADDERLPSACADGQIDSKVRAVASFYAPTDLLWAFDHPANEYVINGKATLANFLGGNPHESPEIAERFHLASPVAQVSSNSPPTLLIHGGHDQLVRLENMQKLADRLNDANVPHQTIFIGYAQHGFDYNFYGFGAQIVKPVLLEFLRENTRSA